ncbi:MAG: aminotransferase class IV, partial [Pseudomonadota bacterium]|nr:aminotransferase class IV [Pseudomonadota bacterium]
HQAREAWLIEDNGTVGEGAASNAYIVSNGEVITHPTGHEILGGITRDVLLKLAKKAGIPVAERPFSAMEMKKATEAFLTSTSANVLPVVKIDDMTVGGGKPGPVTHKLQELYSAHVLRQTGKIL